ncbi:MAG: type II toxin-antitoxin system Phd/YefM family antitoxin, partial [Burkholderiaceae bacterium]
ARAEAGEEVIITRHNKPVAKIVPLHAMPQAQDIPKFVQRTFNMGPLLVPETNMNHLAAELENQDFIALTARLEQEAQQQVDNKRSRGNEAA